MSQVKQFLNLAREELETAELLLENDRYRACISRSYYAMYHATQGLLLSEGLSSRTHKGMIKLFGQHFVKTGKLSTDLARALGDVYDLRRLSDYDETFLLNREQTRSIVESARMFIREASGLLNP
ncbi:MAG TPA: HEPN domain-containing protein [Coleofasciculaceae cyanobacterium]